MTLRDKRAAFYLSFTLDFLETLKKDEKPKGRGWNRIEAVQESANRLLDVYRPEAMRGQDVDRALRLMKLANAFIHKVYGRTRGKAVRRRDFCLNLPILNNSGRRAIVKRRSR
jgi:hypothetical protein